MPKKKEYINNIDWMRVFNRVPEITGLNLTMRGMAWEGRYYITTEPHPYKSDKLKIKLFNGCVWLHEQGGASMSLPTWLIQFGGARDYKHAYQIIKGNDVPLVTRPEFIVKKEQVKYISLDVLNGAKAYDLNKCPLFRWMCTLFPESDVRRVWDMYNVSTNDKGEAVFWYTDADGRICYDKIIRYLESGKRDKSYGGSRKFKTADGYTARPYFGSHLIKKGETINIVESEKSCLIMSLAVGGIWVATGGKTNLKDVSDDCVLWPDMDAISEWSDKGIVKEWWLGENVGEHDDVADLFVRKVCKFQNYV